MDPLLDVEDPPDGDGWWPSRFGVDRDWCDARGTAYRAVTNHPTLQARRRGDLLDLRQTDDRTDHTYRLVLTEHGYLAQKEG
ncbi:hypothetical protein C6V83_18005 [Gordonia iterans]|uniref:Uncharacterized protein n=1 Tax=Gordonia iterans TaxID=1004901 RepID=A0A2S0KJK3_9ACTN|nr:hypothetical protein [Gordonia iterans]AVM01872.1 hypothetical protein C6V83_18005 [Gordonia iterans]